MKGVARSLAGIAAFSCAAGGEKMTPTGGSHLSAVEEKGKEAPGRIGLGGGKWAGGGFLGCGERKEMELGQLGWNQGEEKEKALHF